MTNIEEICQQAEDLSMIVVIKTDNQISSLLAIWTTKGEDRLLNCHSTPICFKYGCLVFEQEDTSEYEASYYAERCSNPNDLASALIIILKKDCDWKLDKKFKVYEI